MIGQPEKRARAPARDWSNQGGAAHNPGWQHPERGQDTGRQPLGLEPFGGACSQEGAKDRTGSVEEEQNHQQQDHDRGPDSTNSEEGQEERGKGRGVQPQPGKPG